VIRYIDSLDTIIINSKVARASTGAIDVVTSSSLPSLNSNMMNTIISGGSYGIFPSSPSAVFFYGNSTSRGPLCQDDYIVDTIDLPSTTNIALGRSSLLVLGSPYIKSLTLNSLSIVESPMGRTAGATYIAPGPSTDISGNPPIAFAS
jgi:hypothetical protein